MQLGLDTSAAARQVVASANAPTKSIDWHLVNSITGSLLALVTIWQIIRHEKK